MTRRPYKITLYNSRSGPRTDLPEHRIPRGATVRQGHRTCTNFRRASRMRAIGAHTPGRVDPGIPPWLRPIWRRWYDNGTYKEQRN